MKAQVSMDLILAVAVAFVAVSAVLAAGSQVEEMQKEAGVRKQLEGIGSGLAAAISASAVLDDADSASVSFSIPKILVAGESQRQPCSIRIGAGTISLSYDIIDLKTGVLIESVTAAKSYVVPGNMTVPNQARCGETLVITKS